MRSWLCILTVACVAWLTFDRPTFSAEGCPTCQPACNCPACQLAARCQPGHYKPFWTRNEPYHMQWWNRGWQRGPTPRLAQVPRGYLDAYAPGPPTASVGYPYYTLRGPRDFLLDNPPTIGY